MAKTWVYGTYPVAVSDSADCRDCDWSTRYQSSGKWNSKALARAKAHVRLTGHKVEYRQNRFNLLHLPEAETEET